MIECEINSQGAKNMLKAANEGEDTFQALPISQEVAPGF